ncbi:hypothetical protein C7476_11547 [Phyllobacterium bourgognense]|uniref:Short subunit dehydrogenase n=1 Tax=Phyllobacterium bourgognense TaxID=314236 RepID=A0A368YIN7_9HYPH|nr:hypothetical protein C7476_11547 [Phyllobacterium bourgognense]
MSDCLGHTGSMRPIPDHGELSCKGSNRLEDMRAVIAGGDSGIGRAVTIAYAREGAEDDATDKDC